MTTLLTEHSGSSREPIKKALPDRRVMARTRPHGTIRPMAPSRSIVALSLAALLAVAACGTNTTSPPPSVAPSASAVPTSSTGPSGGTGSGGPSAGPSPTGSADTGVYDAIEEQVVAIRGLEPKAEVERAVLDEAELRTRITALFEKESPPENVAANERLYKALGLLPDDADLRELTLDLLSGGVAGFYDNEEKKLYVVSRTGDIGASEKITFAHEFDHALQDQQFPVFTDQKDVRDQSDRLLARQAVYEGDATLLMTLWATSNFTQEDVLDYLKSANDPAQQELLDRMPAILEEQLLYPYTTGLLFIQGIQQEGGWAAVDAMYDRMPVSTEQILHPEKYRAGEAPTSVDLPDDLAARLGDGWTVPLEDSFGEFQTGIWLREGGVPAAAALTAAAGWGGDRLAVLDGPGDAWGVVLATDWDTAAEAEEFEDAATTAIDDAGGKAQVLPGAGGTARWVVIASDDPTLERLAGVLGLAG
jgi:hypothetical protein